MPQKSYRGSADIFVLFIIIAIMLIAGGMVGGFPTKFGDILHGLNPTPQLPQSSALATITPLPTVPALSPTTAQLPLPTLTSNPTGSITLPPPPNPTNTTGSTTPSPTSQTEADLVINRLRLTDEKGKEKSTFSVGEKIYPKVLQGNRGESSVKASTGIIISQIYADQQNPVSKGKKSDINVWIQNGLFSAGSIKTYAAWPGDNTTSFFKGAKYWTRLKTGKFTARAFINYDHTAVERTYTNNQYDFEYTIVPAPKSPTEGNNAQPNNATCGGRYNFNNPLGKNFGDPECTFSKDKLFTLLEQTDPGAASYWFYAVIPCESPGYDANLFFRFSPAGGAWGLFQMDWGHRSDSPAGQGLNGIYDRGDVAWPKQVTNATTFRLKMRNGSWRYWECAKDRW